MNFSIIHDCSCLRAGEDKKRHAPSSDQYYMTHISCPGPIPSEPRACHWPPLLLRRRPISYYREGTLRLVHRPFTTTGRVNRDGLYGTVVSPSQCGLILCWLFLWEESVRSIHPRVQVCFATFMSHTLFLDPLFPWLPYADVDWLFHKYKSILLPHTFVVWIESHACPFSLH